MPRSWNAKRERQYEHIKESERDAGRSTERAEEIAARTVNKQRAATGEAATSSVGDRTKQDLYDEARRKDVPGRSTMTKAELARALARHG